MAQLVRTFGHWDRGTGTPSHLISQLPVPESSSSSSYGSPGTAPRLFPGARRPDAGGISQMAHFRGLVKSGLAYKVGRAFPEAPRRLEASPSRNRRRCALGVKGGKAGRGRRWARECRYLFCAARRHPLSADAFACRSTNGCDSFAHCPGHEVSMGSRALIILFPWDLRS
jgi:hypothetical protein